MPSTRNLTIRHAAPDRIGLPEPSYKKIGSVWITHSRFPVVCMTALLFHKLFDCFAQLIHTLDISFLNLLHYTRMNMFRKKGFIKSV